MRMRICCLSAVCISKRPTGQTRDPPLVLGKGTNFNSIHYPRQYTHCIMLFYPPLTWLLRLRSQRISRERETAYDIDPTTAPLITPISPVPAAAIRPVYQVCDMVGTIRPNAAQKEKTAASPGGRFSLRFQSPTLYVAKLPFRKRKCSVRTMAAKTVDQ